MEATEEKKSRTGRRGNGILLFLGIIALYILMFLAAVLLVNSSKFSPNTSICGVACGGLEADEAAAALESAAAAKTVRLCAEDGTLLRETTLAELAAGADIGGQVHTLLQNQRAQRGLAALHDSAVYEYTLSFAVDEEALKAPLDALLRGDGYTERQPQDAALVLDVDGVRIDRGDEGNIFDLDACARAAAVYLAQTDVLEVGAEELDMADALVKPAVAADDPTLNRRLDVLSRVVDLGLTVNFCGGRSYTFTPGDMVSILQVEYLDYATRIHVDAEALAALLDGVIDKLGADGVDAKYGHVYDTRQYVYLTVDDTGYKLDRDTLNADVARAILKRSAGPVAAQYDYTWWLRQKYGWLGYVDTAVEISIDNQYLWFYKDGVLLTETPVTTGTASLSPTNRGAFTVSYVSGDTNLTGPTWNYHVDYWIPFDGDIGLHDSYWRDNYGADYYLTDGSHGCVNTPHEPMGIIHANSYMGMAVIVY